MGSSSECSVYRVGRRGGTGELWAEGDGPLRIYVSRGCKTEVRGGTHPRVLWFALDLTFSVRALYSLKRSSLLWASAGRPPLPASAVCVWGEERRGANRARPLRPLAWLAADSPTLSALASLAGREGLARGVGVDQRSWTAPSAATEPRDEGGRGRGRMAPPLYLYVSGYGCRHADM
eukprot:scaffold112038_cov25-Tisochrysis_lutea.AAC.1